VPRTGEQEVTFFKAILGRDNIWVWFLFGERAFALRTAGGPPPVASHCLASRPHIRVVRLVSTRQLKQQHARQWAEKYVVPGRLVLAYRTRWHRRAVAPAKYPVQRAYRGEARDMLPAIHLSLTFLPAFAYIPSRALATPPDASSSQAGQRPPTCATALCL